MQTGPRIYDLFPTLAGPIARWDEHLDRAAAMRFDWVYCNPIHPTGGSGSLYAVADYFALHPVLREGDARPDAEIVRDLAARARRRGLRLMLDLVVNHTANDAPLVTEHPEWYARDEAGAVAAPYAVDPDDPEKRTVWGDLAELDYAQRPERAALVAFFASVVRHYVGLGVSGFRCDAAYKVPADVWTELIAAARDVDPAAYFAAETLGCSPDEVAALASAGFDALFNSAKWWDLEAPWFLEQYEAFRRIAPSIAFPESHDTPRLAADLAAEAGTDASTLEARMRFAYLSAAVVSSGVMVPMGFEFGAARALDVVATRPEHAEPPALDLRAWIAAVNAARAAVPALNVEGAQRRIGFGGATGLLRDDGAGERALTLLNAGAAAVRVPGDALRRRFGDVAARDASPDDSSAGAARGGEPRPFGDVDVPPFGGVILTWRDAPTAQETPVAAPSDSAADPRTAATAVAIERVEPQIDGGRFAVKRVAGDAVAVAADCFRDGHDRIDVALVHLPPGETRWRDEPMAHLGNDRYAGSFTVDALGTHRYAVEAWPDAFRTWRHDTEVKRAAGQPVALDLEEGRLLVAAARDRARGEDRVALGATLDDLALLRTDDARASVLLADGLAAVAARNADRALATRSAELRVDVDRPLARFSAWYELFPRSAGSEPGAHGTFNDVARRLPAIAAMGFDVLYLPPIHPIGHAFRKGKNNTLDPGPDDVGSPWAIGNEDGGHVAIEPRLGTLDDFARLVEAARAEGLEIALDFALQCSPDHPYVREHPEWFSVRPDGTIKYAENPPKKYQDIVNFNFFGPHARELWDELRDVVLLWIERGVTVFRVDNPHTKPFAFWEWLIADVRAEHPATIFLAEAFTRPSIMRRLGKIGFAQSYTYFTWRTTKDELTAYVEELAHGEMAEYYRPNFWPTTPDILPPFMQTGGLPAFRVRLALAATLSSSYGIYSGYELAENAALPGREEFRDSEKYEIRRRDYDVPHSLAPEIARWNAIRRASPALQDWRGTTFYRADDPDVIFYGRRAGDDVVLVAVNLDPFYARETTLWFPTGELGLGDDDWFDVEDLLAGGEPQGWRGSPHGVRLDPAVNPAVAYRITVRAR